MKRFSSARLYQCFAMILILQSPLQAIAQSEEQINAPSSDEITVLQRRVLEFKNTAELNEEQAQAAETQLNDAGNCGDHLSQKNCLQNEIDLLMARANLIEDETATAQLKAKIQELQMQVDAPAQLHASAKSLSAYSSTLSQMINQNDYSYKAQFNVIWKSFLGSWKYFIKPGPLVALSLGGAGYGVAELSHIDADAKNAFGQTASPAISVLKDIGTYCGYGVCIVPFAAVAAITKDPNTIRATDAMMVGTGLIESVGNALKYSIRAPRPTVRPPGTFDPYGTPSLHASESSMISTVICRHDGRALCGLAIAVTAGVEISREVGGDHYPSQLLLGTGIGVASGIAADRAVNTAFNQQKKTRAQAIVRALTGNVQVKGYDFSYLPNTVAGGGVGAHLIISRSANSL